MPDPDTSDLGFVPAKAASGADDLGFVPAKREASPIDAAVRGLQTGYGARIAGVGSALAAKLNDALHAIAPQAAGMHQDAGEAFRGGRDDWRAEDARAQGDQPAAFLAGEMAPALASAVIPGAGTVKGATAIGGALSAMGSNADTAGGMATDVGTGALVAGGGAKLLQLLGRLGIKLPARAQTLETPAAPATEAAEAAPAMLPAKTPPAPVAPQRGATRAQLEYRSKFLRPKPDAATRIGLSDLSEPTLRTLSDLVETIPDVPPPAPAIGSPRPVPSATPAAGSSLNIGKHVGTAIGSAVGHPFIGRMIGEGLDKGGFKAFTSAAGKMAAMAKTMPQVMGRFGPPLLQAATRGADALAVTHYQLSQTPEYQELMRVASQDTR